MLEAGKGMFHVVCNASEFEYESTNGWISSSTENKIVKLNIEHPTPSNGNHCFETMILYTSEKYLEIGRFADVKTCVMNSSLNEHVCLKHFDIYDRIHCKLDTSLKDTYTVYLKARILRTKITRKCFLVTIKLVFR